MKCVCGYEYEYDHLKKQKTKEAKEFVPVNVVATVSQEYERDRTVNVYACPKCETLKIER